MTTIEIDPIAAKYLHELLSDLLAWGDENGEADPSLGAAEVDSLNALMGQLDLIVPVDWNPNSPSARWRLFFSLANQEKT